MKKSDAKEILRLVLRNYFLNVMMLLFFMASKGDGKLYKIHKDQLGVIILDQGTPNYGSMSKSSQKPLFVHRVLLKQSHMHLFAYCLWLLS